VLGALETDHHVERGRFPSTVRSEQPDNLALSNAYADVIDDAPAAVRFLKIVRRK
jgi:hypothetical protein